MALVYTTDSSVSGSITTHIQEFTVTGTPTWSKQSKLRRVWSRAEQDPGSTTNTGSVYYGSTPSLYVDSRWAWGDDNPSAATSTALWPSPIDRVLTVAADGSITTSTLVFRDRMNLLGNILSGHGTAEGPTGHLADATGATYINDYYFPTVSHLSIVSTGGASAGVYPMSSVMPAHPRNYIQPYLRSISLEFFSARQGIGGYLSNDGLRLIEPNAFEIGGGPGPPLPIPASGFWIRPGVPIQPLIPWISLGGGAGLADNLNYAAHGLPPIEVSAHAAAATVSSGYTIDSVDVTLTLTQIKFDNSSTATDIATVNVPFHSTDGIGGSRYVLSPTDSGHSATLDSDCRIWTMAALCRIHRSAGWPFGQELGTGYFWHKRPCHVQPWALSCGAGEESTYLPGSLYDPYA